MPTYLLQQSTSSEFIMLHISQNKMNRKIKKEKRYTIAHRFRNCIFIYLFNYKELNFKERDTIGSFIFPMLGFGGFEVYWFILITNLRWSEVKDGSLRLFSYFISYQLVGKPF